MTCTLSRKKKALLLLCMLCCIFVAYLQIFTIRSKANAVVGASYDDAKVLGFPTDLLYTQYRPTDASDPFSGYSYGILPNFNVYILDSGNAQWVEGYNGNPPVQVASMSYFNRTDGYDIAINFSNPTYLNSIRSAYDVVFSNVSSFRSDYGYYVILPYSVEYHIVVDVMYYDGSSISVRTLDFPYHSPVSAGNSYYYSLFREDDFSSSFVNQYGYFLNDNGQRSVWMTNFEVFFRQPSNFPNSGNSFMFDMINVNQLPTEWTDFLDSYKLGLRNIFQVSEVSVNFEDLSWTDWLVNSVGSFMNFEFIPGFSISGIFALLVGMSLFMVFLKVFAGG